MEHILQKLHFYCTKKVPKNLNQFCHFRHGGGTHFLVLARTLMYALALAFGQEFSFGIQGLFFSFLHMLAFLDTTVYTDVSLGTGYCLSPLYQVLSPFQGLRDVRVKPVQLIQSVNFERKKVRGSKFKRKTNNGENQLLGKPVRGKTSYWKAIKGENL